MQLQLGPGRSERRLPFKAMLVCSSGSDNWMESPKVSWPDLDPAGHRTGRVIRLLPPYHSWTLFAIAFDQWGKNWTPAITGMRAFTLDMASGIVQIVLSSDQKRLQKGLIPGPGQLPHFRHQGRVGSGSRISTDCHLYYAGQRRAGFGTSHPASPLQKCTQKKMTWIMGISDLWVGNKILPGVGRSRYILSTPTPTPSKTTDSDRLRLRLRSPGSVIRFLDIYVVPTERSSMISKRKSLRLWRSSIFTSLVWIEIGTIKLKSYSHRVKCDINQRNERKKWQRLKKATKEVAIIKK